MRQFISGMLLGVVLFFFLSFLGRSTAGAVEQHTMAFVANAGNNHVQVIDVDSGRTLTKLYTGATPWRLRLAPDAKTLWVQHWYAQTTAVVDLKTQSVSAILPERGPGIFNAKGNLFWSFSWPESTLEAYDTKRFKPVRSRETNAKVPYDLALAWKDSSLFVGEYDPVSKGNRRVYDFLRAYSMKDDKAPGVSLSLGDSPARMRLDPTGRYLVVANLDGEELSLVNQNNAKAKITLVPSPQDILFGPHGLMVVLAWKPERRASEIVTLQVDWSKLPWPEVTPSASKEIQGGLVAGQMDPSGKRFYALDRPGRRLVVFDLPALNEIKSIPVGDVPYDLVVTQVNRKQRDRWTEERLSQTRLKRIIENMKAQGKAYQDLQFVEEMRLPQLPPEQEVESGAPEEKTDKTAEPTTTKIQVRFQAPDSLRIEYEDGGIRLAQGGKAVTITPEGRFFDSPRQDLLYVLYALHSLPVEDVIRHLAGDVPGSPFLKNGIAVDVLGQVKENGHVYDVIGTQQSGARVSQLWVDANRSTPVSFVEQFPVMEAQSPHQKAGTLSGIAETKLQYEKRQDGYQVPVRMVRVVDGLETGRVTLSDVRVNPGLQSAQFDLARLGVVAVTASEPHHAKTVASKHEPGRVVPGMGNAHIDHPAAPHDPYNSNPPTSGTHTRYLTDWGIHKIPIPPETQVHNLEDGGVLLQYNCPQGCVEWVTRLEQLAMKNDKVVVAPYPLMKAKLALTAWERIEILDQFDEGRVTAFINAYAGKDHHPEGGEGAVADPLGKAGE